MDLGAADTTRSAVFFLESGSISRRLLYAEFESVLDHIVAIDELSGRRVHAVFVDIDGSLNVAAAVFFLLEFDQEGMVNVDQLVCSPSLLAHGVQGPDLGAGAIVMMNRANCPQGVDPELLWDPLQAEGVDEFAVIADSVRENGLALSTLVTVSPHQSLFATTSGEIATNNATNNATNIDSIPVLSEKVAACVSQGAGAHASSTIDDAALEAELLDSDIEVLVATLLEQRQVNDSLREALATQTRDFKQMRGLISSQIGKIEEGEELGRHLIEEFNVKMAAMSQDLAEREAQLSERDDELARLGSQLGQYEKDLAELQEEASGTALLQQMQDAGITHFASQPGAGEFNVSAKDMPVYLASPVEYAARFCCVELSHYQAWLGHHERPVCRHLDHEGQYCDLPVHRVESPTTFVVGESDCCSQHRSSSLALSRVIKAY